MIFSRIGDMEKLLVLLPSANVLGMTAVAKKSVVSRVSVMDLKFFINMDFMGFLCFNHYVVIKYIIF